jgi:hypothetical protein
MPEPELPFPIDSGIAVGDTHGKNTQSSEQAAVEQDPKKFLKLITEINELLMTKEGRLLKDQLPHGSDGNGSGP